MKKTNTQIKNNDVNNIVIEQPKQLNVDTKKLVTDKYNDKIAKIADDKQLCAADVARLLQLNEKKARAFLRRHNDAYIARKQRFLKTTTLFIVTFNALCEYKKSLNSNGTI